MKMEWKVPLQPLGRCWSPSRVPFFGPFCGGRVPLEKYNYSKNTQLFSDPGKKKGRPFLGKAILVKQPPKKKGKKGATEQLRTASWKSGAAKLRPDAQAAKSAARAARTLARRAMAKGKPVDGNRQKRGTPEKVVQKRGTPEKVVQKRGTPEKVVQQNGEPPKKSCNKMGTPQKVVQKMGTPQTVAQKWEQWNTNIFSNKTYRYIQYPVLKQRIPTKRRCV